MRIIMTCAGTGGHINPAIAIANLIKDKYKDTEFLFIGTKDGMENDLVKNAGYEIKSVRTGKLIRSFTLKNIEGISNALKGITDAKKIMKEFKPDLVIGTGGYICLTVMKAAKSLKIKYILHESNAFPGLAVKLTAKKAYRVLLGFEEAKSRLKLKDNLVVTGNISKISKEAFDKLDREECKKQLGIDIKDKKIILVTFGSQGAKYLNDYIIELARRKNEHFLFVLIAGNNNYDSVMKKVKDVEKEDKIDLSKYIKVEKFVYDMDKMYKSADLCITRAGAMTINELETVKVPAILIPLPTAAENHQYYNAKVLQDADVATIIEQKDLNVDVLNSRILEMFTPIRYKRLINSFDKLPKNSAADKILNEIRIFKSAYLS